MVQRPQSRRQASQEDHGNARRRDVACSHKLHREHRDREEKQCDERGDQEMLLAIMRQHGRPRVGDVVPDKDAK